MKRIVFTILFLSMIFIFSNDCYASQCEFDPAGNVLPPQKYDYSFICAGTYTADNEARNAIIIKFLELGGAGLYVLQAIGLNRFAVAPTLTSQSFSTHLTN